METVFVLFLITAGLALICLIVWISMANTLARLSAQVDLTISTLVAQLDQRKNLIPDTLRAARVAVQAQRDYLDKMLDVRKGMHPGVTPMDLGGLPPDLAPMAFASSAASAGRSVSESNPELNVDAYPELQRIMQDTEKDVTAAYRFYWAAVAEYNGAVRSFPTSIVASVHGYWPIPTLKLAPQQEVKPDYF